MKSKILRRIDQFFCNHKDGTVWAKNKRKWYQYCHWCGKFYCSRDSEPSIEDIDGDGGQ